MYRVFPHTADVGLEIEADDLNSLFEDAARGLFSLIVAEGSDIKPRSRVAFQVSGKEIEFMLFDWLNELLFAFENQRLLFSEFEVSVGESGLRAMATGEPLDLSRHTLDHEVKAITYHELSVKQSPSGWAARVIVDI